MELHRPSPHFTPWSCEAADVGLRPLSGTNPILRAMGFWGTVVAEIVGGFVTAALLGVGAAWFAASQQVRRNDERVADLEEDNRRWFRDRQTRVHRELLRLE